MRDVPARMQAVVRLATCVCLLLSFTGLAAAPLAGLLPGQDDCGCGCSHENGKLCCCRRAARERGPTLESAGRCPGKCQCATAVPLRVGLFLPLPRRAPAAALTVVSRAASGVQRTAATVSFTYSLRDRSPPPSPNVES